MVERQERAPRTINPDGVEAELKGKLSVDEALVGAVLREYPPANELRARTEEDVARLNDQAFERHLARLGDDAGDPAGEPRTRTARDYGDLLQRAAAERNAHIESASSVLTGEEQTVVDLRFGLRGEAKHSLRAVSRAISRSPSTARRIEMRALTKLAQTKESGADQSKYWSQK